VRSSVSIVVGVIAVPAVIAAMPRLAPSKRDRSAPSRAPMLSNDLAGSHLFSLTGMEPGHEVARCVVVTAHRGATGDVRLYRAGPRRVLNRYLWMTVTRGTARTRWRGSCKSFWPGSRSLLYRGPLADYPREPAASVVDPGLLKANRGRAYRFTISVLGAPEAEGLRSNVSFGFQLAPRRPHRRGRRAKAAMVATTSVTGTFATALAPPSVKAPAAASAPAVSGLPVVGQTLTADLGTWTGQGLTLAYQWERCNNQGSACSDIAGATEPRYLVTAPDRRNTIRVQVTASSSGGTARASSANTDPIAASVNPIVIENAQPGTSAWWPGVSLISNDPRAEAYTSQVSVSPGDALQVHVSTNPAGSYRLELYRLGWYGGMGGRLMSCVPSCTSGEPGFARPTPPADPTTGELDAQWPVTDTVPIGADWTSGYYEVKIVLTSGDSAGAASLLPFIVKATPTAVGTAVLVQVPVNTWQAYNNWGGKSLYDYNSTNQQQAVKVSFDRPYAGPSGGQWMFAWELNLVRFLERNGIDTSYVTDTDVDADPQLLLAHRLDVTAGHDEYWTKAMRDGWDAARDAGVNLFFAGANTGYWQARYEDGGRTLVEYRSATADPNPDLTTKTVEFRALSTPRPECELEGVEYTGTDLQQSGDPPISYMLDPAASSDPLLAGTGLQPGEQLPDLVGYEYDAVVPGCATPGTVHVLLTDGGRPYMANAVYYRDDASGALVFASGSMQFSWALDDWSHPGDAQPAIQALVGNILDADLGYASAPSP
jgi:hypothetical protein